MKKPKLVELSAKDRDGLIERIQTANLPNSDKEILTGLIEFNNWLQFSLQEKSISVNRLQNLFFGNTTQKSQRKKNKNDKSDSNNSLPADSKDTDNTTESTTQENAQLSDESPIKSTNARANSGKLSHNVYINAEQVTLHPDYNSGDLCPEKCGGKLTTLPPGVVVKITGQGFAKVTKYIVEKLRCNLCGLQVNAHMPDNICDDKYDATFKAQLCMLKYYMGMPFYRIQGYQNALGVPLPDSTQWDLIDQVANDVFPAFKYLEKLAASGNLVHADDTNVKIISNIKAKSMLAEVDSKDRKGTFTTGILSYVNDRKIYLFYSSKNHAGENMRELLLKRSHKLPDVKYMCDALSRNIPESLKIILLNCLAHGRRKFVEIEEFFPPECKYVINALATVYHNDEAAKNLNLKEQDRLEYHQQHSTQIMEDLNFWLNKNMDDHLVEPNSSLGKAIKYMLNHWKALTQFLRVAGAPLDNNILEQALKIPIRIRKNSMFFATEHGAYVGSMILSIICTCMAAKQNPIAYLTALQTYKNHVVKEPHLWMPWNYQDSMLENQLAA